MSLLEQTLLSVAKKSVMNTQYACCIVYKNKIISTGYNKLLNHATKHRCLLCG